MTTGRGKFAKHCSSIGGDAITRQSTWIATLCTCGMWSRVSCKGVTFLLRVIPHTHQISIEGGIFTQQKPQFTSKVIWKKMQYLERLILGFLTKNEEKEQR